MSSAPSLPTDAAATTPLEAAEARARLSYILSSSLDAGDVISHFFTHLQPLLRVDGLHYINPCDQTEHLKGQIGEHLYNHRLSNDGDHLGDIVFSRDNRFNDSEIQQIELLLTLLTYPLHNALKYAYAQAQALQDSLTGVGNRAALDNALRRELQLSERYDQPLSLLVMDIDHFKHINDKHGHSQGDRVLKEIAQLIQQVCRTSDMVFRYGGEEFVVLLSKTDEAGARVIAERLRKAISQHTFLLSSSKEHLTISIGISARKMLQPQEPMESLFERADRALYQAKAKGRNCVITAREDTTESTCVAS